MKFWLRYFLFVVLLSASASLIIWRLAPQFAPKESLLSPLPSFATITSNAQVSFLDFWAPFIAETIGGGTSAPTITAHAALVYDLETNKTLYERAVRTRMPMASLTKIMTAIIALEHKQAGNAYIVRPENIVGENSMGLMSGEVHPLENLLYGLLLPSGNDAAEVIAGNYPGGRTEFISAMNKKALSLGLENTNFTNPSGLEGDGKQYTTAYDLLVITRYALENFPEFKKIVSTYEHAIPATSGHKEYLLYNETNLLTTYPGVKGVKTGYTPEAGLCLVTYLEYEGHKVIGVILNSENRRQEMKDLLDYSLLRLNLTPPAHT